MDDNVRTEVTAELPQRNTKDHLAGVWKHRAVFIQHAAALLLGIVTLYQAVPSKDLSWLSWVLLFLVPPVVYGAWKTVERYFEDVPESLSQHQRLKRLYVRQKAGWHFLIAHHLIRTRVERFLMQYQRLTTVGTFEQLQLLSEEQYPSWVKERFSQYGRLFEAAVNTAYKRVAGVFQEFSSAYEFHKVEAGVLEIDELCDALIRYETSLRVVIPPDRYRELHESMYGWTETLVNGVAALNDFLRRIGEGEKPEGDKALKFHYSFEVPSNLSTFGDSLSRLQ